MKFIGIDLETTGFDLKKHSIIEIGAILLDTESDWDIKGYRWFNILVRPETDFELPTDKNGKQISPGLSKELILDQGVSIKAAIALLQSWINVHQPQFLVAHNAKFEQGFLREVGFAVDSYAWIDTMLHCFEVKGEKHPKLGELCVRLGVEIPDEIHRALPDVQIMLSALNAYGPMKAVKNRIARRG